MHPTKILLCSLTLVVIAVMVSGCRWSSRTQKRFDRAMAVLQEQKGQQNAELDRILDWLADNYPAGGAREEELWKEELKRRIAKGESEIGLEKLIEDAIDAFASCRRKDLEDILEKLKGLKDSFFSATDVPGNMNALTAGVETIEIGLSFVPGPGGSSTLSTADSFLSLGLVTETPGLTEWLEIEPEGSLSWTLGMDTLEITDLDWRLGSLFPDGTRVDLQSANTPLSGAVTRDDTVFPGGFVAHVSGPLVARYQHKQTDIPLTLEITLAVHLSADAREAWIGTAGVVDAREVLPSPPP